MSDDVHATVRFRDEELVEALEQAEGEHGSRSEAIRNAVATAYAGVGEGDGSRTNEGNELPVKAREGYHKLVEWAEVGGRLELDTATSILANHLNIPKEGVEGRIIKPLVGANVLWKDWSYENVWVVVGTLDGEPLGAKTASAPSDADATESEIATDGGEAREQLDELAAAGLEVADGN